MGSDSRFISQDTSFIVEPPVLTAVQAEIISTEDSTKTKDHLERIQTSEKDSESKYKKNEKKKDKDEERKKEKQEKDDKKDKKGLCELSRKMSTP